MTCALVHTERPLEGHPDRKTLQRDWDLIRALLRGAEALPPGQPLFAGKIQGWDQALINPHIKLLDEADHIQGQEATPIHPAAVLGISMRGYELLDAMRNDTVWARIKSTAKEKSIDLSFEAIGALVLKSMLSGG